jgi:hypothetical protein
MKQQLLFGTYESGCITEEERKTARLSADGVYRYSLGREWDPEGLRLLFVALNPSKADGRVDDMTVQRMRVYARRWGFGAFDLGNLYALRSSDPRALVAHLAPIGPETDEELRRLIARASLVICAWGNPVPGLPGFQSRAREVLRMIPRPHVLRINATGHPAHPLYLPAHLDPKPWIRPFAKAG